MVCLPHERLAIREAPARWAVQSRFVDDGRIEIESNIVKGAIRSIALNRKNALLAGSEGEGYNRVIIVFLIETCSLKIVAPKAHLSAALARIVADHLATKNRSIPAVAKKENDNAFSGCAIMPTVQERLIRIMTGRMPYRSVRNQFLTKSHGDRPSRSLFADASIFIRKFLIFYSGAAPSAPVASASPAAADSAALCASMDTIFACNNCDCAALTSVMAPTPLR